MTARLARAFLVIALLLAQQAAIGHQLKHAAGTLEQDTLCESHDLLGTVLGVASGAAPVPQFLSLADARAGAAAATAPQSRALSPKSRGPPLIS